MNVGELYLKHVEMKESEIYMQLKQIEWEIFLDI